MFDQHVGDDAVLGRKYVAPGGRLERSLAFQIKVAGQTNSHKKRTPTADATAMVLGSVRALSTHLALPSASHSGNRKM